MMLNNEELRESLGYSIGFFLSIDLFSPTKRERRKMKKEEEVLEEK